jgi:hypothetical protein
MKSPASTTLSECSFNNFAIRLLQRQVRQRAESTGRASTVP